MPRQNKLYSASIAETLAGELESAAGDIRAAASALRQKHGDYAVVSLAYHASVTKGLMAARLLGKQLEAKSHAGEVITIPQEILKPVKRKAKR